MKTIKSTYIACLLGCMASAPLLAQGPDFQDTLQLSLGDSIKLQVVYKDRQVLENSKSLDLNQILEQVNQNIEKQQVPPRKSTRLSFTIDGKEGDSIVSIIEVSEESIVTTTSDYAENSIKSDTVIRNPKHQKKTRDGFTIDLGLNTFLNNGSTVSGSENYKLRPWGSRYVSIEYHMKTRIGGKKSPLYLSYGLELAWNNFMFQEDVNLARQGGKLTFTETDRNFTRNKLVANYLSIPIMPMIDFSSTKKRGFIFGIGGFAGYRINSWTKQAYFEDGDKNKNKDRDGFYLNDFRYGLMAVIGVEDMVTLFVKYDLNPLFEANRGPADLNTLSFGIRL